MDPSVNIKQYYNLFFSIVLNKLFSGLILSYV